MAGDATSRIRLHADDFGATPATVEQIADCWEQGALDGFSILANGDALAGAAARLAAQSAREAYVAVHLNLSEGRSAAPPKDVALLVDEHGELCHSFGSLAALWVRSGAATRRALLEQVDREWSAQIRAVQGAIRPRSVDALDGHIHVHALPFLAPVAARLARRHAVPAIRIPRERFHVAAASDLLRPWFLLNVVKFVVLRGCSIALARAAAGESITSPPAFVGVLYTGRMTEARLDAGVRAAAAGTSGDIEVAVHVGRPTEGERVRWARRDGIWADASHPHRDAERSAVCAYSRRRRQST